MKKRNGELKICFWKTLWLLCLPIMTTLNACSQETDLNPGVERWSIKTSVLPHSKTKMISLGDLLKLPSPIDKYSKKLYDKERIKDSVKFKGVYYKEGDIVTTKGYVQLVALERDSEKKDGDYHIQVLPGKLWADSCLVIEVPYPDFIKNDETLKEEVGKARQFVYDVLLKGKNLNTKGKAISPPLYVQITGQLFFDGTHLNGEPRGKQDPATKRHMKSYTCWEIHPVIKFKVEKTE
jgi:hypothetical protein